ncbi:MAG: acetyl-CoA carboxylase biotin carboxyl carrier protein [Oscillospiraceae bacterium]|nr:acetyl-CoA carboxylase biotin carboxyl carrier protein [Oscillospiraceae bacterium]
MNIEHIKQLAEILDRHGLTSVEVEEDKTKIKLEKTGGYVAAMSLPEALPELAVADATTPNYSALNEIKSPLVGVYYSAASPDVEPFLKVGTKVSKGDTVCIVETMKLMNEVTADKDGEVIDICVQNGDVVEFGQVLFKLA